MSDHQVTCPYCGMVILSADSLSILAHYKTSCTPVLTATTYRDPKTRLCYKWMALHGWRLYHGSKVLDRATFEEVVRAVASGDYLPVKGKERS